MKKLRLAFVGALIIAITFTGCTTPNLSEPEPSITPDISHAPTPELAEYIKLTPEEAQAMMSDDAIILDVRTQDEFDERHIANAVLLPDYEVQEKAETVLPDKTQIILVYCRTGNRSERAAKELTNLGYKNVYDFGGIENWTGEIVGHWLYPSYYNYFGDELPPDTVAPIDFTTTKKINEQMPEFTFYLAGTNVKSYILSDDSSKYRIAFYDYKIENITITDETGALVQKIGGLDTENRTSEEDMYGLSFDDWNFDGYLDISLWKYPGDSMGNNSHYYWLWDNMLGQFVENTELMEISDVSTISIKVEESQLECYSRFGAFGGTIQYYEYINDKFMLVSSVEYEAVPAPDEEDKIIWHIIEKELIDGELITTADYYEDTED